MQVIFYTTRGQHDLMSFPRAVTSECVHVLKFSTNKTVCLVVLTRPLSCQVWFREGIHPRVPEGSSWEEVEVPREVAQLSAGPSDLLWALLWDGNLLVRTGLSLDSPTGQGLLLFTLTPQTLFSFPPHHLSSSCLSLFLNQSLKVN